MLFSEKKRPAMVILHRRAGNEMLYQMQALQVIEIFKMYEVKKIITICPHCFNILKTNIPILAATMKLSTTFSF